MLFVFSIIFQTRTQTPEHTRFHLKIPIQSHLLTYGIADDGRKTLPSRRVELIPSPQ